MPIIVTRLPDEPIVVATFESPQKLRVEIPQMFQDLIALLPDISGPYLYVVTDTTRGDPPSFAEIVFILGETRVMGPYRREDLPVRLFLVGNGPFLELVAKALGQLQYGGYQMRLFSSLDEALAFAREELEERAAD